MVGLQWKKETLHGKIRLRISTQRRILLLTGAKKDPVKDLKHGKISGGKLFALHTLILDGND